MIKQGQPAAFYVYHSLETSPEGRCPPVQSTMSASMMKTSTRQAASARPSASAKRCVAPSALMTSAPRVAKASPALSLSNTSVRPTTVCAATMTEAVAIVSREYDLKWRWVASLQSYLLIGL